MLPCAAAAASWTEGGKNLSIYATLDAFLQSRAWFAIVETNSTKYKTKKSGRDGPII